MKFMFNKHNPPFFRNFFIGLLFLILPSMVFCKSRTLQYLDQTFTLYINPAKVFVVFGPWGEEPVSVDRPVREEWGVAASFGIVTVYQKRDEVRWAVIARESGQKIAGGILQTLEPEDGMIDYVTLTSQNEKGTAKVVFDTGAFTVYQLDRFGRQKVVREGKIEKK